MMPIIAAPNATLLQVDVASNRKTPAANNGTAATRSTFFHKGLRRQSSLWRSRSLRNS